MEIVDGEQHWGLGGDPRDEPEERMQRGEVVASRRPRRVTGLSRTSRRAPAAAPRTADLTLRRGSGDERLQQLADQPERQLLLEL